MAPKPELQARGQIDRPLAAAGWAVQEVAHAIFRLKDDALADSDSLPPPEVIAQEIVDDLEAALEQFRLIAADLAADRPAA